ncbi:hypothetical protein BGV72_07560 [Burkholderia ubonensis]|nr:hypothetical protein BGV72_07560 [Burkholderia ubonensis]
MCGALVRSTAQARSGIAHHRTCALPRRRPHDRCAARRRARHAVARVADGPTGGSGDLAFANEEDSATGAQKP